MTDADPYDPPMVYCCVLPRDTVYIGAAHDLMVSFERFRHRWKVPFLPVAGYECDPMVFQRVTSMGVNREYPIRYGAAVFRNIGVAHGAKKAFQRHLRVGDGLPALFADWVRAVGA